MFSLKRISGIFLSALCMLCCVCGFSFAFAEGEVQCVISPSEGDSAPYVIKSEGNQQWAMYGPGRYGGKVKLVSFSQDSRRRIVAQSGGRTWVFVPCADPLLCEIKEVGRVSPIARIRKQEGYNCPDLALCSSDGRKLLEFSNRYEGMYISKPPSTHIAIVGANDKYQVRYRKGGGMPSILCVFAMCFLPEGCISVGY